MREDVTQHLAQDWEELIAPLEERLESSARASGAFQRRRGVQCASDLLRLILMYALLPSLRLVVIWASGLGVCDISRQALSQRIHQSDEWLRQVLALVLQQWFTAVTLDAGDVQRILLRDASTIARRGSPGTEMRLHLTWDLLHMQPAMLTVTDEHGGEDIATAGVQAQDLIIGDRAYGLWRHIQVVLAAGAYFLFRITWSNCPLRTLDGQPFNLIKWLESLPSTQEMAECTVTIAADPQQRPLRLLVGRLPTEAIAEAQERVRRNAAKKHRTVTPETLLAAQFCILLTNLAPLTWPLQRALALYRIRWQIEWCFRRWKSLCGLDKLPSYPAPIATPAFLAKVLLVLLLQHQMNTFPWADCWATEAPPVLSTVVQLTYWHMFELLCPIAAIRACLTSPQLFIRHLRSSRRKRPLQMQTALRLLQQAFAECLPIPDFVLS